MIRPARTGENEGERSARENNNWHNGRTVVRDTSLTLPRLVLNSHVVVLHRRHEKHDGFLKSIFCASEVRAKWGSCVRSACCRGGWLTGRPHVFAQGERTYMFVFREFLLTAHRERHHSNGVNRGKIELVDRWKKNINFSNGQPDRQAILSQR